MKKIMISALVCAIACVLTSCGGGNTPSATVEKYYEAAIKGDYKKALDQVHFQGTAEEAQKQKEFYLQLIEEKVKDGLPEDKQVKKVDILGEEVNEEDGTAVVTANVTYANGSTKEEKVDMKKVDGKWFVDEKK